MVVVGSAVTVAAVYAGVYAAVLGYLPWFMEGGFGEAGSQASKHVMSVFFEQMFNRNVASAFSALVAWTIFGSCFSMMYAYSHIPWAAAKDGAFFRFFGHSHPSRPGLADHSLLTLSAVTFGCCFLRLELVIEGMLTSRLIIQFAAQSIGVLLLRAQPPRDAQDAQRRAHAFKVPFAPLTNVVTIVCFVTLFVTTQNYLISGQAPLLECSAGLIGAGCVVFVCVWDRVVFVPEVKQDQADSCDTVGSSVSLQPLIDHSTD
eukprot:TRINITY_DN6735_c0_g1_i2.p1 TRINITY_DN6735_c0_g1~~TRINITY_DN6735_c0_g1_i2.p1  ORF type:complete len:260 (-),score=62.26 TRINITY_DN6735_c0_g1_i2:97-876(-)